MTRKIIQIALDSHPQAHSPLHALCDDGSVWRHEWKTPDNNSAAHPVWVRLTPIPQDDP
jgi:mRNA-degrading endonuclease HigB of HigAB toxin-antitoxin module